MSRAIIPAFVAVLILAGISGGMSAETQTPESSKPTKSPELKVLDRMVGSWRAEVVEVQAGGEDEKATATFVAKWSLQGKYIEFRITDSDGKEVILHLFTYDSDARVYNMWSFVPDSQKPTLTPWQWDESEKTLTGQIDLGDGITMPSTTHFIADDRWEYTGTTKDASGNVLGEMKGKVFRKTYGDMSAETQPLESPVTPKSPELNVLDRLAGSWRFEQVERQATGEEKKSTGTFVSKWSLQGKYIEIRVTDSDGKHGALELWTYDSDAGVYKMWFFDSESPGPQEANFLWNESKETLTLDKADLGNGITARMMLGFIGNDRLEWTMTVKDATGNVMQENKGKSFRTK